MKMKMREIEEPETEEGTKRISSRVSTKKIDYLQMEKGKFKGVYSEMENEEEKRAKRRKRKTIKPKEKLKKGALKKKLGRKSKGISKLKVRGAPRVPKEKIPDNQLSLLLKWREEGFLKSSSTPPTANNTKIAQVKSVFKADLAKYGTNLQAILINATWKTPSNKGLDCQSIEDLNQLNIPWQVMRSGIIFIFSEKEVLSQLIDIMEEKGFVYVENMQIIMISCNKCQDVLDAQKAVASDSTLKNHNIDHSNSIRNEDCSLGDSQNSKNIEKQANNQIKNSKNIKNNHASSHKISQIVDKQHVMDNLDSLKGSEINELMLRNSYPSFKKSKHTLLMFRKFGDKANQLELRHQRTSDVVFDLTEETNPAKLDLKTKEYVYNMIETLLPKAIFNPTVDKQLKMMELFGDSQNLRPGWISICEKQ